MGDDGNAGKLDLGLSASTKTGARAYLDYGHRLVKKDTWSLSAFANAHVGVGPRGTDAGALAGLRLRW